ncbi:MAG TPA: LptF/LptG family permease, partial [Bacteroidota bacterium]|nr:LptF/LptG family permease [Bacteroidota bacterium]
HRIAMNAEGFSFQRSQEGFYSRGDRELSGKAMQTFVDSLSTLQQESSDRVQTAVTRDLDEIFSGGKPAAPPPAQLSLEPALTAANRISSLSNLVRPEYDRMEYLERQRREYLVEIHKKYSIPVACVVFVLIGAPLGIMARRGTFGTAASLSLGFFLLYWICLIGGERLGDRGIIQPWLGMWAANIILGTLGLYLTVRSARENLMIDWTMLAWIVPRRWRSETQPAEAA